MDIENLDAGQEFEELPITYTIFITEHDIYEKASRCIQLKLHEFGNRQTL